MDRREFLQGGAAVGVLGLTGGWSLPASAAASRDSTLWLNWNENPAGLSPLAREAALEALSRGHRYPDLSRAELAADLASSHGVGVENIVLGCGSTQILRAVVAAHAGQMECLVLAEPTFEAVVRYQRPFGVEVSRVPLNNQYAHDLQRMREEVGERAALVYLCNPNNPTATLTPSAEIDAWIREASAEVLFLIDEAYYEYVENPGYRSASKWVLERPNVVVTRTFSKIFGMAGLRLGYGLAQEATAKRLREFLSADNVNGVVVAAARAAIADPELVPKSRQANEKAKSVALACLDDLELEHLPSHASFLMHRVEGDLKTYIQRMRDRGIRVGRPFPPLLGFNRLSLGLPEEMERWAATLEDFRARGWV
jgi:histidinol-phosphate aminotransferase